MIVTYRVNHRGVLDVFLQRTKTAEPKTAGEITESQSATGVVIYTVRLSRMGEMGYDSCVIHCSSMPEAFAEADWFLRGRATRDQEPSSP